MECQLHCCLGKWTSNPSIERDHAVRRQPLGNVRSLQAVVVTQAPDRKKETGWLDPAIEVVAISIVYEEVGAAQSDVQTRPRLSDFGTVPSCAVFCWNWRQHD